jgi:hypothetical protein
MKDVEQLGECYRDYAHFMFSTMIEIESALPEDVARRNVDTIRDIVRIDSPLANCFFHKFYFLACICLIWCSTKFTCASLCA